MKIPNLVSKLISLNIHVFFLGFYLQLQDKATLLTAERKKVGIMFSICLIQFCLQPGKYIILCWLFCFREARKFQKISVPWMKYVLTSLSHRMQ